MDCVALCCEESGLNPMNRALITKTLEKIADFYGFWGASLLIVKTFESTIDSKRALADSYLSRAFFCCGTEFVCVRITHDTQALEIRTFARKPPIAARALNCLSLFFLGGLL